MKILYFDYAATTPIDARVADKMLPFLTDENLFANPSSLHLLGHKVSEAIEVARAQVAAFINAEPEEIIWTSGATEADNLAIKGVAHLYRRKGHHIVTMRTEHKAVLDTCQHLEKEGYRITYLKPLANGLLDIDEFTQTLCDDTILVSIMHVNNETGIVQDIQRIANITRERNILLHVDAAQSAGKILIDVKKTPVDLLSLCAHKLYGPKGIGALYLRKKPRVRVEPLIHGGGHEQGMRSGTLATHQIVGMGEAFCLAHKLMTDEITSIKKLRDYWLEKMTSLTKYNMICNTDGAHTVPHILNIRFERMVADVVLAKMSHIAVSTASACQGKGTEGSYVLRAMGLTQDQIQSSLRFSFGRFTTFAEIDKVVGAFKMVVLK